MMIFLILSEICSAVSKNMIMEESAMLFLSGVSVLLAIGVIIQ